MKKQNLKKLKKIINNFFKKLIIYLFYIQRFLKSIVKAPIYLLRHEPTEFFLKIKKIERKISPVAPSFSFNFFSKNISVFFNPRLYIKAVKILFTKGPIELINKIKTKIKKNENILSFNHQYQIWLKKNYPSSSYLSKIARLSKQFRYQPKISIITPVYNPEKKHLIECIESVRHQKYPHWELCLIDDASTKKYFKDILLFYQKKDKRIKVKLRSINGHICRASNDALKLATGDYIALLDHDDFLWPNALYEVVKLLNKYPHAQFIYSDEDRLDFDGKTHLDPFFKPDWSPDYLRSINYITHFAVLKRSLINKIGGFRLGTEGAQDWDLFLRATYWLEKNIGHCHPLDKKNPILHIPTVLYSWRKTKQSTSAEENIDKVKRYAFVNQKKVLKDDLKRRRYQGWVEATKYLGLWCMRYKINSKPLVSIIIPTKDKYYYFNKCLNSILQKTTYKNYELIIVDTGSTDKKVINLYKKIKKIKTNTQILKWEKPFNYAAVCNFGAENSKGDYLIFLNNDTEIITPNWIELMLEYAQRKEVGVVGCKLLFPNNKIQHAGIILGIKGDPTGKPIAGHAFHYFFDQDQLIFPHFINAIKNYSAVTFACVMIRKKLFLKIKLDSYFKVSYNDVDFCLKMLTLGKFIVYQPYAKLYHFESVSVGRVEKKNRDLKILKKENKEIFKRWSWILLNDPYLNKNFSREDEGFNLNI